jgi:flagellar biosynthesis/type III secretory pathway protein FliH
LKVKKNAELEIIKSFGEIIIDVASESIDIKFKNQVVDIIRNLFSKIYDESLFKIYIDSNYMEFVKNTPEINNLLSEYNVQLIETKTENKGDLKISWENGEIQSSLNEFHEKISQLISSQER